MYYEINVAQNGKHFFATAERSITTPAELKKALPIFQKAFPESEGYAIMVTKWDRCGERVNVDQFLKADHLPVSGDDEFLL